MGRTKTSYLSSDIKTLALRNIWPFSLSLLFKKLFAYLKLQIGKWKWRVRRVTTRDKTKIGKHLEEEKLKYSFWHGPRVIFRLTREAIFSNPDRLPVPDSKYSNQRLRFKWVIISWYLILKKKQHYVVKSATFNLGNIWQIFNYKKPYYVPWTQNQITSYLVIFQVKHGHLLVSHPRYLLDISLLYTPFY